MAIGDWMFRTKPTLYENYLSAIIADKTCTSWYGHRFQKFDAKSIFCPTCGTTKAVK